MTADPEVIKKLDMLISMVRDMQGGQSQHADRLNNIEGMVRDVQGEQRAHAERLARLDGKYDVMLAWLQSTDQRFGALMAPVVPPKKPAAQ